MGRRNSNIQEAELIRTNNGPQRETRCRVFAKQAAANGLARRRGVLGSLTRAAALQQSLMNKM